jgi:hypothetical protein
VLDEFYRDFFRVQDIPSPSTFTQDGPNSYHAFPTNHYGNAASDPVPSLQNELVNLGVWFTQTQPGTFEDMFRSNLHFMECVYPPHKPDQCFGAGPWSQWAYGIEGCDGSAAIDLCPSGGWDGTSAPLTFPEAERVGLLTRLAFLAHDTHTARPIRRGLKIREMLLCDPIPPPENCDVVKPPDLTGVCTDINGVEATECTDDMHCAAGETCVGWDKQVTMTVREKVEAITETPGTTCVGCHSTFINGFGHALGHFSSQGQYWETEHMFTSQKNGVGDFWYFLAPPDQWAPIDASGTTVFNGQMVSINGAQELSDVLVNSGQMEWCWSREYFRFAMGRIEWEGDAEDIEALAQSLRDGSTLGDAFKAVAYLPQFKELYKPTSASGSGGTP